jgi:RimJ/RimL family protein N-acetyltransferase
MELVDPGSMMATTHVLDDGTRVRLRLTRPSDLRLIEAFLRLPEHVVRRFAFYDPRERITFAAAMPGTGGEEIVGLAELALAATGVAEIGVVVADDVQGSGIGKLLSEALAALALQRGATHLRAVMPDENAAMRALMERLGSTVETIENGVTSIYARLPAGSRRRAA